MVRRRYTARRIAQGTHTALFSLLSHAQQCAQVRKLTAAGMSALSVSQLTGLDPTQIAAILEAKS